MAGKRLFLMFVACLLVLSFSSLIVRPSVAQIYTDVTVSQAKVMIETNSSLVLLDVRNQSEYDAGHIRNAKLIPVWQLTQNLDELSKTDEILVYCSAGVRSANASSILVSNGFLHIYNMLEGMNGWVAAGYPVYVNYSSMYSSFSSMQAAIDNATVGQTVYVGTGFYNELLSVDKSMLLVGENASTTIINGAATVLDVTADNVSISDLTIQYTGCDCFGDSSVNVMNSQNVNVTNNIIISDDFGIHVDGASGVIVADNNITHVGDASIVVLDSIEASVYGNDMTATGGIEIENCTESSFWNNTIVSDQSGIFIAESTGDTVFGNNVSSIYLIGLSISSCYNNSFFDNDIVSNNGNYRVSIGQSYNNSIFRNCFIGNGGQVLCYDNSTNSWDNGFEGNFWSSYTGVDADLNGIGDTPYIINSMNKDNYPLMGMFHSYNTSPNYELDMVSNSSVDDFEYVEANRTIMLRVSNTTADQTVGFCRISIPHGLINPYNGSISVAIDDGQTPVLFLNSTVYDDGSRRWIYFTYPQSTHEVIIVPEFPVSLLLLLFMIATAIAAAVRRRRRRWGVSYSLFARPSACVC